MRVCASPHLREQDTEGFDQVAIREALRKRSARFGIATALEHTPCGGDVSLHHLTIHAVATVLTLARPSPSLVFVGDLELHYPLDLLQVRVLLSVSGCCPAYIDAVVIHLLLFAVSFACLLLCGGNRS
jgi:hypothetical protein